MKAATLLLFALSASTYGCTHPPCVSVPKCTSPSVANVSIAAQADGKGPFPAATQVQLCYDDKALKLHYIADDEKLFLNHYDKCNSDMWNNEVLEIFIAPDVGDKIVTAYHEVELSPHNALYVAAIHNPFGNGTDKSNTMVDCTASGVQHKVQTDAKAGRWEGFLTIPWALVIDPAATGPMPLPKELPKAWRINLFRVLMLDAKAEVCDDSVCSYGAWSPDDVGPPSNYHVTKALGTLLLA